ncbi:hypothetical protein CE91St41_38420 [Oscillospiraceae bacterium]|nr:hypothetical protein CE91St40_38400 [Oscillospiraceae bacterium]BDF76953.1 hypothetical protein CE91St41_38420 [Oscillospiraceae bacterium]
MLELLAPAGSMEAVSAAVQNGADAVYMGYGDFNARRNAKNFSPEEFAAAVSYCHLRGVKVYLTLNTLLTDRELPEGAKAAAQASELGVDAVLVQDLGVLRMLRQAAPDMPVHASTQMTVHNLAGVLTCAELGMTRVVLSRELSADQIAYICEHSPIEIEVFAHGALCMCYSGQCFLSSVIGGRSGNRGLCAQPCRLKYGWGDKADSYPLSLKDMSLAGHLQELRKMGVACVKLEGRMKRPEYVAVVTSIYARAIREGREPTARELEQLAAAFSRQGFTDGYFMDRQGPDMFGVREEQKEPRELFAAARATYENGREAQRVPVTFYALIRPGEPAKVGVEDDGAHVATVEGPVPEPARTKAITREQVEEQLAKTGGTPFRAAGVKALVEPGLSLPLSALNAMRRQALDSLTAMRSLPPVRRTGAFKPGVRYEGPREAPALTVSVRRAEQVTPELLALAPALVYVPLDELAAHPEKAAGGADARIGVILPRVAWDREWPRMLEQLQAVRELGVEDALIGNLGMLPAARRLGFTLRGDYGLEIYNSQALKELRHLGLASATASFELKLAQVRDLSKAVPLELITYGRLPLMIMESCIIKNRTGRCNCQNVNTLTDRKGARFPVVPAPGCRNEILNCKKLFLADKAQDYRRLGLWAQRLLFTTENPRECVQVAERYLDRSRWEPGEYTRGLYYRDVE